MRKRIISLFLCAILLLSLLPTAALAETLPQTDESAAADSAQTPSELNDTLQTARTQSRAVTGLVSLTHDKTETGYDTFEDAYDAAASGDTITFLKDGAISSSSSFDLEKDLTIDIGNYTVTSNYIYIKAADVTFQGIDGTLSNKKTSGYYNGIYVEQNSSFSLKGTFKAEIELYVYENATLLIEDVDVDILCFSASTVNKSFQWNVTLEGGTYQEISCTSEANDSGNIDLINFLADGYAFAREGDIVNNYNLSLSGSGHKEENLSVVKHTHDFTFYIDTTFAKCKCGKLCPHANITDGGLCQDCTVQMLGKITDKDGKLVKYFTHSGDIYYDWKDGVTVTLLRDSTVDFAYENKEGIVTFDFNGFQCGSIRASGKSLTVKGTGSSTGTIKADAGNLKIVGNVSANYLSVTGGNLIVESGTYGELRWDGEASSSVKLSGGTYNRMEIPEGNAYGMLAEGYAFFDKSTNVVKRVSEGYVTDPVYVAEHSVHDYTLVYGGYCGCGAKCPHTAGISEDNKCLGCGQSMAVHLISGETTTGFLNWDGDYETGYGINEAYQNAKDGDTLKLFADNTYFTAVYNEAMTKALTIELNGYRLTNYASEGAAKIAADVTVKGNGYLEKISVQDGGSLTLTQNVSVDELTVADDDSSLSVDSGWVETLRIIGGKAVELSGGTFAEIECDDDSGYTIGQLVKSGCGYKLSDKWLTAASEEWSHTSITQATVKTIPLTKKADFSGAISAKALDDVTLDAEDAITKAEGVEGTPTYQWYQVTAQGETQISNATGATYKVPTNQTGTVTYRVKVTLDDYTLTADYSVTLEYLQLADDNVTTVRADFPYSGQLISPQFSFYDAPVGALIEDQHYTLSGDVEKTDVGDYTLIVKGTGIYEGTVTKVWKINPLVGTVGGADSSWTIDIDPEHKTNLTYDGTAKTPEIVIKDENGNVIPSREYDVVYQDNTNAGTATITITDKEGGNYTVSGEVTFTIAKASYTATINAKDTYLYGETIDCSLNETIPTECTAGCVYYYSTTDSTDGGNQLNGFGNTVLEPGNYWVYAKIAETENYKEYVTATKKITVTKATPTVNEWPRVTKTVYVNDDALTDSDLIGGSASYSIMGKNQTVEGKFVIAEGADKTWTTAGDKTLKVQFVPNDAALYNTIEGNIEVTVSKRNVIGLNADKNQITDKEYGTAQDDLGLPTTVTLLAQSNSTTLKRFENVPITWTGTYDPYSLETQTLYGIFDLTDIEDEVENTNNIKLNMPITLQPKPVTVPTFEDQTATYTGSDIAYKNPADEAFMACVKQITYTYEGIDGTVYESSNSAPTNAGTYKVTANVTMENGYAALTTAPTAKLTIAPLDIGGEGVTTVITFGEELTYNGENQQKQIVSVTVNGRTLNPDTDYAVYANSNYGGDAQTYTLQINGTGNYTGSASKDWAIAPLDITGAEITLANELTYTGSEQQILIKSVKKNGLDVTYGIVEGTDKGTNAGNGYVLKITGCGNFTGEATRFWEIRKADQTVTAVQSAIETVYGETDVVVAAQDAIGDVTYSVTSGSDVITIHETTGAVTIYKAGSAKVTITASGDSNHNEGSCIVSITVAKRVVTVTALDQAVYVYAKAPDLSSPVLGKDYTISGVLSGDTLDSSIAVKLAYESGLDMNQFGEYDIIPTVTGEDARYTFNCVNGTLDVQLPPAAIPNKDKDESATDDNRISFVDVPENSYFKDAVDWAVENGITEGMSARFFDPDGICTRAQAVTFLWRAAGKPAPETATMPFEDVARGSYYYEAVLWAVENGITVGTSATSFSPDENCSRAHIVTFLWRAMGKPNGGMMNPFMDVEDNAYYIEAVLWAVAEQVTNGTGATTFSPDDNCTRAQIVTLIYRALAE